MKKRFLWVLLLAAFCVVVIAIIGNRIVHKPKGLVKLFPGMNVSSANGLEKTSPKSKPESNLPVDSKLVAANNNFGIEMFKKLYSDDNILISATSISIALSMTYNGAGGETSEAMAKTLGYQEMTLDQVNKANSALHANLEGQGDGVILNIANSLWGNKGFEFENSFLENNRKYYSAEIKTLDFSDPSSTSVINSWVSDKTEGKIKGIIDNVDPNAMLYLINAIYFKGEWTDEFKTKNTKDGIFTLLNGKKKTLPMMNRKATMRYYRGDNFQAVSLPYGKGKRTSMYLFLPDEGSSVKAFLDALDSTKWDECMKGFSNARCELTLPRFKMEYKTSLKNVLSAMGMSIAFESKADFFKMWNPMGGYIHNVLHKTYIDVDEKGTEAAAVTAIIMAPTGLPPRNITLVFDRPFVIAIRDNKTGIVLFMGAVLDPQ